MLEYGNRSRITSTLLSAGGVRDDNEQEASSKEKEVSENKSVLFMPTPPSFRTCFGIGSEIDPEINSG
jgi:hypothetical protein